MIALCAEHHAKADAGAFTPEQLRAMKRPSGGVVSGKFDWLRHRMLSVVGGNFYYETPVLVQFRGQPQIWYTRDDQGYLLLSLRMVSATRDPRLRLDESDWIARGDMSDFESPPAGRRIAAKYANGDELKVEFFELLSAEQASSRYSYASSDMWKCVEFPVTTVEIVNLVGGTGVGFGPSWTKLGGVTMTGNFVSHCGVGLSWS
jgi:hypothetical protein